MQRFSVFDERIGELTVFVVSHHPGWIRLSANADAGRQVRARTTARDFMGKI
jgi:hypothetical protein